MANGQKDLEPKKESFSPDSPDQPEVSFGAGDVCGKLIRSAAATRPVALWPGTAGVIQLINLHVTHKTPFLFEGNSLMEDKKKQPQPYLSISIS